MWFNFTLIHRFCKRSNAKKVYMLVTRTVGHLCWPSHKKYSLFFLCKVCANGRINCNMHLKSHVVPPLFVFMHSLRLSQHTAEFGVSGHQSFMLFSSQLVLTACDGRKKCCIGRSFALLGYDFCFHTVEYKYSIGWKWSIIISPGHYSRSFI